MRSICVHRAHGGLFSGALQRAGRVECGVVLHARQTGGAAHHDKLRRVALRER